MKIRQDDDKSFHITKLSEQNEEFIRKIQEQEMRTNQLKLSDIQYKADLKLIFEKIDHFHELIGFHEKTQEELAFNIESLESNTLTKQVLSDWRKNMEESMMKLGFEIESYGNQFKATDNFIEKYMPIRVQAMISN